MFESRRRHQFSSKSKYDEMAGAAADIGEDACVAPRIAGQNFEADGVEALSRAKPRRPCSDEPNSTQLLGTIT